MHTEASPSSPFQIKTAWLLAATLVPLAASVQAQQDATEEVAEGGVIEELIVTANKREQSAQDVASAISALSSEDVARGLINDITRLEAFVPGLRVGVSGGEVRPALRGARTNEVGVAGTGIAEQVVGIFQDGIYIPTTTSGLGAYLDVDRIEVLRGPQGTLYGRNTFAGSINVISNKPDPDGGLHGSVRALTGSYSRFNLEGIVNVPVGPSAALRLLFAQDAHDGVIENLDTTVADNDLRNKDENYTRIAFRFDPDSPFSLDARLDTLSRDAKGDAIWGYQQIAGYHLAADTQLSDAELATLQTSLQEAIDAARQAVDDAAAKAGVDVNPADYATHATATQTPNPPTAFTAVGPLPGHIYQVATATPGQQDPGPYQVYRNALSLNTQDSTSITLDIGYEFDSFDLGIIYNNTTTEGDQYYDSDYSDGNADTYGGFGRRDDQTSTSLEVQLLSNDETSSLEWVAGFYNSSFQANWGWLANVNDSVGVPGWGAAGLDDPHTTDTTALFGQLTYSLNDKSRVTFGLRTNSDDKQITDDGSELTPTDWSDSNVLYKLFYEMDMGDNSLIYVGNATGVRTGGVNDRRAVQRGAPATYDSEEVTSLEFGWKNILMDGKMAFNLAVFNNTYSEVKAQVFAFGCSDADVDVGNCLSTAGNSLLTFEYYENGGDSTTFGVEADLRWLPSPNLLVTGTAAFIDAEFDANYKVGNQALRPLLGLGNQGGRQNINAGPGEDPTFSFSGYKPALSPDYQIGVGLNYFHEFSSGAVLTPSVNLSLVGDYYAFDVNIPEVLQSAHSNIDFRLTYEHPSNFDIELFILNLTDEEVLTRAVVHSQRINLPTGQTVSLEARDGGEAEGAETADTVAKDVPLQYTVPVNSVQTNYNNPMTFGLGVRYRF